MNNPDVNDEMEQIGISPVVGAILMVAIVVVLAAVMLFFVTDLADQPRISQAGITVDESVNGVEVTVHNVQKADSIRILVDGSEVHQSDSVSAGDSVTLIGVSPGDNIVVIGGDGDSENVLKNHEVENAYSPSLSPQAAPSGPATNVCSSGGTIDPTNMSISCDVDNTAGTTDDTDIEVIGQYAFVTGQPALRVYDLSDPSTPEVAEIGPSIEFGKMEVEGNYIYTTGSGGNLYIVDISNPTSPVIESTLGVPGVPNTHGWTYHNGYAYIGDTAGVSDWEGNLTIADVSNPTSPSIISTQEYSWNRQTAAATVVGDRLYLVSDGFTFGTDCTSGLCRPRLITMDISDKTNPQRIDTDYIGGNRNYDTIHFTNPDEFITDVNSDNYIHVDISNQDNPVVTNVDKVPNFANLIAVDGDKMYTTDGFSFSNEIDVYDISDPTNPTKIGDFSGPGSRPVAGGTVVDGTLYYVQTWASEVFSSVS